MTFNSLQYLVFLPVVLVIYRCLPRRGRHGLLLVASYIFYGLWDWRFCGLLALSTTNDFLVGLGLARYENPRTRRLLLLASLGMNLGILSIFKYAGFFVDSARDLLEAVGVEANITSLNVLLPVGISFYTFQSVSYVVDVYRGHTRACRQPVLFYAYVAYFPQLVAGPIERAHRLLPQIERAEVTWTAERLTSALGLIIMGLVKKVVFADQLAPIANQAFDGPPTVTAAIVGAVAFAGQIYGDFSGYTDIARGSSRLLGVELIENFEAPYLSRSVTEFWRRWHISLSTWLRDYLYIPLGGNRHGPTRTSLNLFVTMLLGGLWHGAAWTFVIWGGLHGVGLIVERMAGRRVKSRDDPTVATDIPAMVGTFAFVCLAWVFFRSASAEAAFEYLEALTRGGGWPELSVAHWFWFATAIGGLLTHDLLRRRVGVTDLLGHPIRSGALVGTGIVMLIVVSGQTPVPFIYFQF